MAIEPSLMIAMTVRGPRRFPELRGTLARENYVARVLSPSCVFGDIIPLLRSCAARACRIMLTRLNLCSRSSAQDSVAVRAQVGVNDVAYRRWRRRPRKIIEPTTRHWLVAVRLDALQRVASNGYSANRSFSDKLYTSRTLASRGSKERIMKSHLERMRRNDSASAGAGCWDVETRPIGLATKKPRACALGSWLSPRCGWAVELLWRRAVRGGAGVLGVSSRG
jgi:hypothetical protein